jgi:hypothetical protein
MSASSPTRRSDANRRAAGNQEVLLKANNEEQILTSFSQDGRIMLFTAAKPDTGLDVFVLPLDGSSKPAPLIATWLAESQAQRSPDGRWVAYMEQEVSGRADVFVRPFTRPGAAADVEAKWQVSTDGGGFPRWLAGGRQLSYVTGTREAPRVIVVDVLGASDGAAAASQAFRWDPPRPLLSLPRGATLFALANDGKRVLAATPVETNAPPRPLTVVMNWLTEIERRCDYPLAHILALYDVRPLVMALMGALADADDRVRFRHLTGTISGTIVATIALV